MLDKLLNPLHPFPHPQSKNDEFLIELIWWDFWKCGIRLDWNRHMINSRFTHKGAQEKALCFNGWSSCLHVWFPRSQEALPPLKQYPPLKQCPLPVHTRLLDDDWHGGDSRTQPREMRLTTSWIWINGSNDYEVLFWEQLYRKRREEDKGRWTVWW